MGLMVISAEAASRHGSLGRYPHGGFMSVALVVLLTVVSLPPSARRDDVVVYEASELVDPCRAEAEAYFVGKGYAIYQWAASHKSSGNALLVNGRLHVGHEDVEVKCRVP